MNHTTILQAKADLKEKKYSAVELLKSVYARIDAVEDKVNAYINLTRETAMSQAEAADKKLSAGRRWIPRR